MLIVVICQVPNSNSDKTSNMQLQASYTDVWHWVKVFDVIKTHCDAKEPYCLTAIYQLNLTLDVLEEEYMGLYPPGQMMNYPLYD
jgi:hypothetical protein